VTVPPPAQLALRSVAEHRSGLLFSSPRDRMWRQHTHHRYWSWLRKLANRPGLDFYELSHCAATMLLERGATRWDVAQQLGHTDGGQLVMELYGHRSEAGARARLLAAWDAQTWPVPLQKRAGGEGLLKAGNIARCTLLDSPPAICPRHQPHPPVSWVLRDRPVQPASLAKRLVLLAHKVPAGAARQPSPRFDVSYVRDEGLGLKPCEQLKE
jgi:hypothetical protein